MHGTNRQGSCARHAEPAKDRPHISKQKWHCVNQVSGLHRSHRSATCLQIALADPCGICLYIDHSIFSYPQRVPTFMGGSQERGWGSLAGTVEIRINEPAGDRISAIKLALTATQVTTIPKTASVDAPSALDRMAIHSEETKTKQVTLLELEQILFEPIKTDSDRDANLLLQGKHVYPFSIHLPLLGNKEKKNPPLLPPSCVIEPLVHAPNDAKLRSTSASTGLFGRNKGSGKEQALPAWSTVKYQLKLTVQRPGLLKRNVRSYAPFVYLPSPPSSAASLLLHRRALGARMAAIVLQRQGDGCQPIETPQDWRQSRLSFLLSPNGPQKLELEKKAGFLSTIFRGAKKQEVINWHEAWTFSMPMSGRLSFPLRSAIPFIIRCTTNKPIDLSLTLPLVVRLYRRVRLLTGKKQKSIAMQQQPVADAVLRHSVESRGVHRINGVISLPPNCVPTFEMPNLSLDYFVAVMRVLDGVVLHKEAVYLACPPPVEPKAAYGPYPSGLAWRSARQAALNLHLSSSEKESAPLAPHASCPSKGLSIPLPPSRQRPSFSSLASSSSSSVAATSRRASMAPSQRSHRSGSTGSAHHASGASSMGHATQDTAAAAASAPPLAPKGLPGMAKPPPATSGGTSGLIAHAPYSSNLDRVDEQSRTASIRSTPTSSSLQQAANAEATNVVHSASNTASIASSTRRRDRYSSGGAVRVVQARSASSSMDHDPRQDTNRYVHTHEKAAPTESVDMLSMSTSGSLEARNSRRGLFVTNADDLPRIPAKASSSAREQANALVGGSSSSAKARRDQRASRNRRTSPCSRSDAPSTSLGTPPNATSPPSSTSPTTPAHPTPPSQQPPAAAAHTSPSRPASVAAPSPSQQATVLDPTTLLTNEDLLYAEDMELDLPPSYFEAVYGAEEEDDDE